MWWQLNTPNSSFLIGNIVIYYYSLILLAALWAAYLLLIKQPRNKSINQEQLTDVVLISLIVGVIGGRLGYIVQNLELYLNQPILILQIRSGGLSIHGALILVLISLFIYSKKKTINLYLLTDLLVKPLLLGQIIGRFGNYFNQELYGYPTQSITKIYIDPAHRTAGFFSAEHFHPVFLYEIILLTLGLVIIRKIKFTKHGQLTSLYLIIFGLSRFITEFWRIGDRVMGIFTFAQIISLLLIFIGTYLFRKNLGLTHNILEKK